MGRHDDCAWQADADGVRWPTQEFERELIVQRTGEGRTRAMAEGVRFGRKPKLTHHQKTEARSRRQAGETLVAIARSYNVHHTVIGRLCSD